MSALNDRQRTDLTPRERPAELTDNEQKYPPPTLKDLQEERLKKERRAKQNREGYRLLRKNSGVAWDPSFDGAFGVWEWEVKE